MAEYFLAVDAELFQNRIRPTLAEIWRRRRFEHGRALCRELLPRARAYLRQSHPGEEDETLIARIAAEELPFDRACWRTLVGEVLLFSACEIPELQTNTDSLCWLVARASCPREPTVRSMLSAMEQVFLGSRDLTFGAAVYRPQQAGYNDRDDVARLADYLASLQPERWTVADLHDLPGLENAEERADELAFVREWFPMLVDMYQRAHAQRHVLVIESIY
jgi:hypothetical protein